MVLRKTPKVPKARKISKRGRRKKPDPHVGYRPLDWPTDRPKTAPEQRVKGTYRIKAKDEIESREPTMYKVIKSLTAALKRMEVPYAVITWAVETPAQSIDETFQNPAVAIHYEWHGMPRIMPSDRFTTAIANLRACCESIEALWKLWRAGCRHDLDQEMQRFSSGLAVFKPAARLASKAHLRPEYDWMEILEIPEEHIDRVLGCPKTDAIVQEQRKKLRPLYHPDAKTAPDDNGQSFQIIQEAGEHGVKTIHEITKLQFQQNAKKSSAQIAAEEAEKRAQEKREADKAKKEESQEATVVGKTIRLRPDLDFSDEAPDHLSDEEMAACTDEVEDEATQMYER